MRGGGKGLPHFSRIQWSSSGSSLGCYSRLFPAAACVTACVALLDRGWGKPEQSSKVENINRNFGVIRDEPLSEEEWLEQYAPKTVQ